MRRFETCKVLSCITPCAANERQNRKRIFAVGPRAHQKGAGAITIVHVHDGADDWAVLRDNSAEVGSVVAGLVRLHTHHCEKNVSHQN